MTSRHRIVVAAAFVLATAAAAPAGDIIQKKDGSFQPAVKGEAPTAEDYAASTWQVLNATLAEISYTIVVGNRTMGQKMPAGDVLDIWLEPRDYGAGWKEATESMASGSYDRAAALFRSFGADTKAHAVVRQKALLNAARALGAAGDPASVKAAEAAYDALLKEFPQTFYLRALWKDRWQIRMETGDAAGAKLAIGELLKLPGVSDSDKIEADLATNTIDLRDAAAKKDQGAIRRTLDRYKDMAGRTAGRAEFAAVNAQARVGMASALLELGSTAEAKGIFEDLSERAKERAVCAAAFNGLGECWFRQNDRAGFLEARRCFLRTQLLYAEGVSSDLVAKALYYAGECFLRLQDTDDWRERARRELNDCIRRFKNSPWADKARRLLPAVK